MHDNGVGGIGGVRGACGEKLAIRRSPQKAAMNGTQLYRAELAEFAELADRGGELPTICQLGSRDSTARQGAD